MSPAYTLFQAQLRQDLRHPKTGKVQTSRLVMTAFSYGFSGLVLAFAVGNSAPGVAAFVGVSFGVVLAAFGIAGSYDDLMGRPKDHAWLRTLPVSDQAHYAARVASIGVLVALMGVSLALPLLLWSWSVHGWVSGVAVFAIVSAGTVHASAGVLAVLWFATLTLPTPALRPALLVARGLLVATLVLAYQLITMTDAARRVTGMEAPWWPGAWFADLAEGRLGLGLVALALSWTAIGLLYAGFFPPRYGHILQRLARSETLARRQRRRGRSRFLVWLDRTTTRLFGRSPALRAGYGLAAAAVLADRLVRGRVVVGAVLPLGFTAFGVYMGGLGDLFTYEGGLFGLGATRLHLSVLIVVFFCGITLVQALQYSDDAEASWAFQTLPAPSLRSVHLGAHQALVQRVLLPLHLALFGLLSFDMPAAHAALHAGYWYGSTLLVSRAYALVQRRAPLSQPPDRFSAGKRFLGLTLMLPVALGFAALQSAAFRSPEVALYAVVALVGAAAVLGRAVQFAEARARP